MRGNWRGPMHGVPFAVKDIYDTANVLPSGHSRTCIDRVPAKDATTVARLKAAGGVLTGKLATHELAHGGPSFDLPWPPARNPWNRDHHPGGSSSGSAVALGLGLGGLVDPARAGLPGGITFVQFLAPGLLASACVQSASFEAAWPVMGKLVWYGNYKAMVSTPLEAGDLVLGELAWIGLRATTIATVFMTVMIGFGVVPHLMLGPIDTSTMPLLVRMGVVR